MLMLIRIILSLTALSVGFAVFGAFGSCLGARNCESTLGESLSWAFLISTPFVVSALAFNGRKKSTSIINLTCLVIISAFVYFLFSSKAIPWNLISALSLMTQWRDINLLVLLVVTLPSILVHTSLLCMLCIAPRNIKAIIEWKSKHNLSNHT